MNPNPAWLSQVDALKGHILDRASRDGTIYKENVRDHFRDEWPSTGPEEMDYLVEVALSELVGRGLLRRFTKNVDNDLNRWRDDVGFSHQAVGQGYEATPRLLLKTIPPWSTRPSTTWPNVNDLFDEAMSVYHDGHHVAATVVLRATAEEAVRSASTDHNLTFGAFAASTGALFGAFTNGMKKNAKAATGLDESAARGAIENTRQVGNDAAHNGIADPVRLDLVLQTLPVALTWLSSAV